MKWVVGREAMLAVASFTSLFNSLRLRCIEQVAPMVEQRFEAPRVMVRFHSCSLIMVKLV